MSIALFLHLFRSLYGIFVKTNFLGMMLEINTYKLGITAKNNSWLVMNVVN